MKCLLENHTKKKIDSIREFKAQGFKKIDKNYKHISLQAGWKLDEEAMALGSSMPLVNIYCVPNIKSLYQALTRVGGV